MEVIDDQTTIEIPESVAICPYCQGRLQANAEGWIQEEDGSELWVADYINLECSTFPGFDGEEGDEWLDTHYHLPYIHWHPVGVKVEKWIKENYRYKLA